MNFQYTLVFKILVKLIREFFEQKYNFFVIVCSNFRGISSKPLGKQFHFFFTLEVWYTKKTGLSYFIGKCWSIRRKPCYHFYI